MEMYALYLIKMSKFFIYIFSVIHTGNTISFISFQCPSYNSNNDKL